MPVKDIIHGSLSDLRNYRTPEEIRKDYIDCYKDGRLFEALQILRNFPVDLKKLDALFDNIISPVQILWGESDPITLVENAHIPHKRLYKSKLSILPTGHYLWEGHAAGFRLF